MSSIFKEDLISKRYLGDGVALLKSNQEAARHFKEDPRLTYKEIITCPLCGSAKAICIAKKERHGLPLDTVVCYKCGLARSYKQLDEESLKIFYSEYYRVIYDAKETIDARYDWLANDQPPKFLSKDKVVVEIGCGGGWNLIPFKKNGFKYYGFDYDVSLINQGRQKGLNLFQGGIAEAKHMGIKTDYLILDQVLEHVSDPVNFLVELKEILNRGALINIYVPSLDLLLWGYSDYDLLGTLQLAHNFLFDEFTLQALARKAGFSVINCCGNNIILKHEASLAPHKATFFKDRGEKVVRFLKLVEFTLKIRTKIGFLKPIKKFYFFVNPIGVFKRARIEYLGKI